MRVSTAAVAGARVARAVRAARALGCVLAAGLLVACGGGGEGTGPLAPAQTTSLPPPGAVPAPVSKPVPVPLPAPDPVPDPAAPAFEIRVATAAQLQQAVAAANARGGNAQIVLADGVYTLTQTLQINAPNVWLVGGSGRREAVIVEGDAMGPNAAVKNLVRVTGSGFRLQGMTLRKAGWHLVQIVGEADADRAVLRECVMQDAWEQLVKVSFDAARPTITADDGLVERCLFEYTAGIGPQYYIGGIDAHGSKRWIVRDNVFRDIASPGQAIAEHAIHFWSNAEGTLVERNLIIDCDRGIGFGLGERGHRGGIIRNNMIWHSANADPFADAGIILENSPDTVVVHNTVFQEHAYSNAIEYRFPGTTNVRIANNLVNRLVRSRDGGSGQVTGNVTNATRAMFRSQQPWDLRLAAAVPGVVDAAVAVPGVTVADDFDREARPKGAAADVGADEF